jgi:hypothetical protein
MRQILTIPGTILIVTMLTLGPAWAGSRKPAFELPRYSDTDGNRINDLFHDADGDGVNDVTGNAYRHTYQFRDSDGDGINDLFRDADGDGINDLASGQPNRPDDMPVALDADGDGLNDVTGSPVHTAAGSFRDEDGDGINDIAPGAGMQGTGMQGAGMDRFVDEDGDGINDGRGFHRERRSAGPDGKGPGPKHKGGNK